MSTLSLHESPGATLLEALMQAIPARGGIRLDAGSLEAMDQVESEYRFPLIDQLDCLRYETPRNALLIRKNILLRLAYALGRADAECGRVAGITTDIGSLYGAVRECVRRAEIHATGHAVARMAFGEGILDGAASHILERSIDLPEIPLVVVPGSMYRNDIDLAIRFSGHVGGLGDRAVELLLRSAKDQFSALSTQLLSGTDSVEHSLAEIAVRRVEIALCREEADARAEERLRQRFRQEVRSGRSATAALHIARNGPSARSRTLPIASSRLLPITA